MARRLLPSIFAILDGRSEPTPFLDILNRLEALSVIPSAEIWQFFRVLRNNLAHDYPESVEQTVNTLNELFGRLPEFVALFESARDAVLDRLN